MRVKNQNISYGKEERKERERETQENDQHGFYTKKRSMGIEKKGLSHWTQRRTAARRSRSIDGIDNLAILMASSVHRHRCDRWVNMLEIGNLPWESARVLPVGRMCAGGTLQLGGSAVVDQLGSSAPAR